MSDQIDKEVNLNHLTGTDNKIYPGDLQDVIVPVKDNKFQKLEFEDPAELICFFDEFIAKGLVTLHKWQTELLESLAAAKATSQHPHKFCLVAANGSGKDSIIAASFAVWFILCKIQSRVIITSSSGTQLTSQTEPAIRRLCEKVNEFFGMEYFKIRQRFITCRLSGSEIRMFATDEAGKAEGYHPIVPNGEMAILVNEGKSVSEEIHSALKRCTGFNYWLEYSSPGEPIGSFYKFFTNWKHTLRVTSFDCPHLSEEEREEDKIELGEHSALYRSKHLALFTSLSGEVVIPSDLLDKLLSNKISYELPNWPTRVGIDLAAGGDENVICITKGNKVLKEYFFRETDTVVTAARIDKILKDNNIDKIHKHIYADDGGIGRGIIDMLVNKGWNIQRIMNQWPAFNKKQYGNRGAENWYRTKRIFEELFFDVSGLSEITHNQLITRKYKQVLTGSRIFLESKKEAKAHGRPSPDRADAFILSLTGLTVDDFFEAKIESSKLVLKGYIAGEVVLSDNDEVQKYYDDNITYGDFKSTNLKRKGKPIHSSLNAVLKDENDPYKQFSYDQSN